MLQLLPQQLSGTPDSCLFLGLLPVLIGSLASANRRLGTRGPSALIAALEHVSSMVNRSLDLPMILGRALEEAIGALGLDAGVVRLIDMPDSAPQSVICRGLSGETLSMLGRSQGDARSPATSEESPGRTVASRISDSSGQLEGLLRKDGFAYFALHPIRRGNRTLGTLALASRRTGRLAPAQDEFVSALTELLGLAVHNVRLREQAQKLTEDLVGLQEVNKIISQSFNHEGIIRRIVVEGKRLVKTSHCHLFLLDERLHSLVVAASTQDDSPDMKELSVELGEDSMVIRALKEKRTIAVDEIPTDGPSNMRLCRLMRCKAAIFAPLITKDQAIGVLVSSDSELGREFTTEDISRAEALAHQAAIAIENARLFSVVSRSQKEWETTFDAMPDCVSVHDMSGRVVRANLSLARHLNTTPQRVIGKYCEEIYGTLSAGLNRCRHTQSVASDGFVVEEVHLPHMGGTFDISVSRWFDKNNRLAGSIHVAKDVSNEKLLQQQLIQSEKLSAIGELISGIAHELNNPLTGVMGYAQLLQARKDLDERVKDSLQKINNLALRCQKIVQNLLSFARKQKPERKLCNINEILERTIDLRIYELNVNNIEVVKELDHSLPLTIADAHQLQQVFLNVMTNAEQAMLEYRGRGRLSLCTRADAAAKRIIIEVADDGPGIPETHLTKIFDPFFTTKEVGKGTGLGLSLSYGIIKEHGGDIYARSKPREGSTFTIELPIIDRIQEEPQLPLQLIPPALQFEHAVTNKRLLVVDDEKYILDFFIEVFRHLPLQVDTASDGKMAMDLIEKNDYDVIVTDFRMPQMSGRELFDWIRLQRPRLSSRIVFVTGDTVSAETRSFLETTPVRFLAKPFKIEDVKEVILNTLQGRES